MTSLQTVRFSRALGAFPLMIALLFSVSAQAFPLVPDEDMTPGVLCTRKDGDYTEDRYEEAIAYCRRNVSSSLKSRIYEDYGVPAKCRSQYTIDHLIPLSMGGNNDYENLWPEAKVLKHTRQNLELETYQELRDGKIDRETAVDRVLSAKLNPPKSAAQLKIGNGCD